MEMDFAKVIEQVPGLSVLAFVVIKFLKSNKERDEAFFKFMDEQSQRFKGLGDACHVVQEESTLAIRENTKTLGRTEKILDDTMLLFQEERRLDARRAEDKFRNLKQQGETT